VCKYTPFSEIANFFQEKLKKSDPKITIRWFTVSYNQNNTSIGFKILNDNGIASAYKVSNRFQIRKLAFLNKSQQNLPTPKLQPIAQK
jgi:hypothetical protein